jgi:alpha-ketoglutarate-dependent taurine dioxygenase
MPPFTIRPLTEHTGSEVIGHDFTQPVDSETRAALNRAFVERHVLVIRISTSARSCSRPPRSCLASFSRITKESAMWLGIRR